MAVELRKDVESGKTKAYIAKQLDIGEATVYRILSALKKEVLRQISAVFW